jgi:hypothetical protein
MKIPTEKWLFSKSNKTPANPVEKSDMHWNAVFLEKPNLE